MKEIRISRMEEGQRFLKWLEKYLDAAPRSFFYKMLRKKTITLNGRKADGSEALKAEIRCVFFYQRKPLKNFVPHPGRKQKAFLWM